MTKQSPSSPYAPAPPPRISSAFSSARIAGHRLLSSTATLGMAETPNCTYSKCTQGGLRRQRGSDWRQALLISLRPHRFKNPRKPSARCEITELRLQYNRSFRLPHRELENGMKPYCRSSLTALSRRPAADPPSRGPTAHTLPSCSHMTMRSLRL